MCTSHSIGGDKAFPLRCDLMWPSARNTLTNETHIFNYRLSRARRVVEITFGILANYSRIYHWAIYLNPNNVTIVVKETVVLPNILTLPNDKVHTDIMDNRAEIFDDAFEGPCKARKLTCNNCQWCEKLLYWLLQ